jgi:hypothetical protein
MRRFQITSLLAVVLLPAAFLVSSCGKSGGQAVVSVAANRVWTDSGLDVASGQTLSVDATGKVWASKTLSYGPEGEPNRPDWQKYSVIAEAPHLGLIAKIGEDGGPFFLGRSYQARLTGAGRLYLGVNDKDAANNKGEFTVTVNVR